MDRVAADRPEPAQPPHGAGAAHHSRGLLGREREVRRVSAVLQNNTNNTHLEKQTHPVRHRRGNTQTAETAAGPLPPPVMRYQPNPRRLDTLFSISSHDAVLLCNTLASAKVTAHKQKEEKTVDPADSTQSADQTKNCLIGHFLFIIFTVLKTDGPLPVCAAARTRART